jgi:hypothetical protein
VSACPGIDPGPDGLCRGCGRPTARYGDGTVQHKRGRWRERDLVAARATLRAAGRRKARILRAIDLDGPVCECGLAIAGHPPLPKPLPWAHGRPCSRTLLDRGHGWDGRQMPAHTAAEAERWQTSHHRAPNAFGGALRLSR